MNGFNSHQLHNMFPIINQFKTNSQNVIIQEKNYYTPSTQECYYGNIYYPLVNNELVIGFISKHTYLTMITLGILDDIGFTLNYESEYIMNTTHKLNITRPPY